ncbi:lipopolysaccharide biosynthesis protein [soil metagenome]
MGRVSEEGSTITEPHDDATTLARGGALNLFGLTAYAVCNFVLVVLVTRQLGAAGAGAFLEAIALFNILARSSMIGADIGLVRFISRFRATNQVEALRRTIVVSAAPIAAVGMLAGLVVFLAADPLAKFLSTGKANDDLATYLRTFAPFVPVAAVYQALAAGSRGFGSMLPEVAVERLGRALVVPAAVGAVLAAYLGPTALGAAWATPWALAVVPMGYCTVVLLRRIEARAPAGGGTPVDGLGREFWTFAAPRSLAGLFQVGILWIDTLLIGVLVSTAASGVYSAATRWLIVGQFAGMAIATAFAPQISFVLARHERDRAQQLFRTATVWFILLAWPAYLLAALFGPTLVLTFGPGFAEGADVLLIVGLGYLFAAATGPVDMVLLMAGRSVLSLVNNGTALAVNVGLNLLLLPSLGLRGAAIAWSVSLVLSNALPLLQVWRADGLHPFSRQWALAVASSGGVVGGIGLVLRLVLGSTWPALVITIILGGAAYVAVLAALRQRLDLDTFLRALRPTKPARARAVG